MNIVSFVPISHLNKYIQREKEEDGRGWEQEHWKGGGQPTEGTSWGHWCFFSATHVRDTSHTGCQRLQNTFELTLSCCRCVPIVQNKTRIGALMVNLIGCNSRAIVGQNSQKANLKITDWSVLFSPNQTARLEETVLVLASASNSSESNMFLCYVCTFVCRSVRVPAVKASSGNRTTARYCCSAGWHWPRRLPLGRWTQMKMCMRCCRCQWLRRHC